MELILTKKLMKCGRNKRSMEGIDFELSNQQKQIRLAAREFAEGEFQEIAREYDRREEFPMEIWKKVLKNDYRSNHYR
jgi:hypothetical protein